MRVFRAAAVIVLLAGPAHAQSQSVPKYGEIDKETSPQEKAAQREAEKAYKNSLSNIPDKGPSDPWGIVRSDNATKAVAKVAPAKRAKTDSTAK